MCPHSMFIVGWRSSNPRTEAIEILNCVPLMFLMCCVISPVFSSKPVISYRSVSSTFFSFPLPLLPPSAPAHPQSLSPPVTTISKQPKPPASALYSCRGPELAASQCTEQPCSESLRYNPLSPQIPSPPSLPPAVGITFSSAVSPLSALRPHVGRSKRTLPCRG